MKNDLEIKLKQAFNKAVFKRPRDFESTQYQNPDIKKIFWSNSARFKEGGVWFELKADGVDISGYGMAHGDLKFSVCWCWAGMDEEIWSDSQFGSPRRCPVGKFVKRAASAVGKALPGVLERLKVFDAWGIGPLTRGGETRPVLAMGKKAVLFLPDRALMLDNGELKDDFQELQRKHPSYGPGQEWSAGEFKLRCFREEVLKDLKKKASAELLADMGERLRMDLVEGGFE